MMPSPSHRQTWDLIPWVVNGTAAATERECVERHLDECTDCSAEYAFQCLLHAGLRQSRVPAQSPPQPSFDRLLERLDRDAQTSASPVPLRHHGHRRRVRRSRQVLTALLVAQTLALSLAGAVLLVGAWAPMGAPYRTLSSTPSADARATIRLVPDPDLSLGELRTLLADAHLVIVETSRDGSILGLAPAGPARGTSVAAQRTAAIARLRADSHVLLAEPVTSGDAR